MAHRLLKIAVAYFVLAVLIGFYMGATEDLALIPVHAHLNLLGWVSLGLIGCIYMLRPHLAETRLAQAHFWLHNIGTPILMVAVALIHTGKPEIGGPVAGIFSAVVVLGIVCFAVNLWQNLARA